MSEKLATVETIWMNFLDRQRLENWTKTCYNKDEDNYETYNCMAAFTDDPWEESWFESHCKSYNQSRPCSYPTQPLLKLCGLCSSTLIGDNLFPQKQQQQTPATWSCWASLPSKLNTTSQPASGFWQMPCLRWPPCLEPPNSPILGKHDWIISDDDFQCRKGKH